jgi:hypothetical protein
MKAPICTCGKPMKATKYVGYYDEFTYWECANKFKCAIPKESFTWYGLHRRNPEEK